MSKALKLRVTDDIGQVVIMNPSETDWREYEKKTDSQPEMYYRSMEEEQLTVFREYIDIREDVEASADVDYPFQSMADHYIKCHIVMVLRIAGEYIIHIERSCDPHRKEVNEAMAAMIEQLSRLAGMSI